VVQGATKEGIMAKTLSAIRHIVRQFLRDEFVSGSDYEFPEDEIDLHIPEVLIEISQRRPSEVRETLTIANKSGTATATTASHLIDTANAQFVAGDVGKTVYNSTDKTTAKVTEYNSESDLTLDTDIMASGESYYLYCYQGTSGKDLNISSITNLLEVEKAEYLTRQTPQAFRNVKVFGDILTLDIDFTPTDGDEVFLYCHKVHQLSDSSSTLKPDLEGVLIKGVVAKAALAWCNEIRKEITAAESTVSSANTQIGNMAARITQAVSDLTSGRALIAGKRSEAITAIGNMSGRVTQALADLTSGRAVIGNKRATAIIAIENMTGQLNQAATDLANGRAKIEDLRTTMDTAIDNMSARITQATNDLASGRDKINTITIANAQSDYAKYAVAELGNAARYLSQAQGYLSEQTTSDRYSNYAARDIQLAVGYLNQARGYLATDQAATEYSASAARELQSAATYLNQARGYLALDQGARDYATYSAREIATALSYLNVADGYFRKLTAQLNISAAVTRYQNWAKDQFAIYQNELRGIAKSRAWRFY